MTSILKPWWQTNMHWVNATWIRYGEWVPICPGWLSLQAHIPLLYLWSLLFTLNVWLLSSLCFFLFLCCFFMVLFLCLSFGCQLVPQFSKLGNVYRRYSELLDHVLYFVPPYLQWGLLMIWAETYLHNIFINDLEKVVDSSRLHMTLDWGNTSQYA